MKKTAYIIALILIASCENTKPDDGALNEPFKENIKYLLETRQIDTLLHLRLAIYEEIAKVKNDETIKTASLYSIIDNLGEVCPKRGYMYERDTRHEDYSLIVTKDLIKADSFFYNIRYKNRTGRNVKNMALDVDIYDLMGQYVGTYSLECNGDGCLNNMRMQIDNEDLAPKQISIDRLQRNVDYFDETDIFKYSRFDLNKLEIEYLDGKKKEYKL